MGQGNGHVNGNLTRQQIDALKQSIDLTAFLRQHGLVFEDGREDGTLKAGVRLSRRERKRRSA